MKLLEGTVEIDDLDEFVARLGEIGDRHGTTVQAFDARYVVDHAHLERAVELADRAIERGENVARDRAVEILLYAAGRRQIDRALEMGVDEGENRVVVLVDGDDDDGEEGAIADLEALVDPGPALDQHDETTLQSFFGVTDAELAATDATLGDLVRERVALLDVEK
ncbi:KEOPS complex subunit Cgi121 [Salinilacihabitans rarus]|uniref:KEOPS complex subunit Cgi121 n=1 Tax=Salinilacihabitans rarus TaxID=2961596 RepID=UPI0020C9353E|nr:KEOPS complex subunit Cgi121 [Salinilacihabitans rarus]